MPNYSANDATTIRFHPIALLKKSQSGCIVPTNNKFLCSTKLLYVAKLQRLAAHETLSEGAGGIDRLCGAARERHPDGVAPPARHIALGNVAVR